MTSTAEVASRRGGGGWLQALLLLGALGLMVTQTPLPWGSLWVVVPGAVAVSLLAAWRFGAWGVLAPVALFAATLVFEGPFSRWAWWIPVSALTGAWMGLREEGGGPHAGERAWMLLPVLMLATLIPWTTAYNDLVHNVQGWLHQSNQDAIAFYRQPLGIGGERLQALQHQITDSEVTQRRALPDALPSILFVWMAILVAAGRSLAARIARWFRWPELTRTHWTEWRLPDGAIWLLLAGLALVLAPLPAWSASAWTLLAVTGLGYCVQGIAVVESLLLARGVPPSIVSLTLVFVFAMAMPVFLITSLCVGVSDVWLDYRRLEDVPDRDPT